MSLDDVVSPVWVIIQLAGAYPGRAFSAGIGLSTSKASPMPRTVAVTVIARPVSL